MTEKELQARLLSLSGTIANFCYTVENCQEMERDEFIDAMLVALPKIYIEFTEFDPEHFSLDPDGEFYPEYVDEDLYESVRKGVSVMMGEDDVFLETHEEDMKYSDTPISASISESLADIFQPLYNFISVYQESEGENGPGAYSECRENFKAYWGQTLCNVMRPLHHLRYS